MRRCPNCNARGDASATCRRCGMDLTQLMRAEQAAERLIAQAMVELTEKRPWAAQETLKQAQALRRTPLAERLIGFIQHEIDPSQVGF